MQSMAELFGQLAALKIMPKDIIEVVIIAFVIYHLLVWVQNTRTWFLFKGIIVLFSFFAIAFVFELNALQFIAERTLSILVFALLIIFQPELRNALEQLGQRNSFLNFFDNNRDKVVEVYDHEVTQELVKAAFALSKTRTGALIVIEKKVPLEEYIKTGIRLDAIISSQLLINIFEHNTPLHDGAVVIRGKRIVAATCYLPLSANLSINKNLGTRHRAAIGASESTDSLTIVVSEETGKVSLAYEGQLIQNLTPELMELQLASLEIVEKEEKWKDKIGKFVKGGWKNAEKNSK